jgi:hypothetical protein
VEVTHYPDCRSKDIASVSLWWWVEHWKFVQRVTGLHCIILSPKLYRARLFMLSYMLDSSICGSFPYHPTSSASKIRIIFVLPRVGDCLFNILLELAYSSLVIVKNELDAQNFGCIHSLASRALPACNSNILWMGTPERSLITARLLA